MFILIGSTYKWHTVQGFEGKLVLVQDDQNIFVCKYLFSIQAILNTFNILYKVSSSLTRRLSQNEVGRE